MKRLAKSFFFFFSKKNFPSFSPRLRPKRRRIEREGERERETLSAQDSLFPLTPNPTPNNCAKESKKNLKKIREIYDAVNVVLPFGIGIILSRIYFVCCLNFLFLPHAPPRPAPIFFMSLRPRIYREQKVIVISICAVSQSKINS